MNLEPIGDRVIVRRLDQLRKLPSGIIIPEGAGEKPFLGEILAVGPGRTTDRGDVLPMHVKAGQKILFGRYTGSEVEVNDERLLVMREDDIFAIVND